MKRISIKNVAKTVNENIRRKWEIMNKRIWFRYFCGIFGDARKLKRNIYCWAAVYRCFDCRHKNGNRFWFWLCVSWCVSNGISSSRETCHFIFSISFFLFSANTNGNKPWNWRRIVLIAVFLFFLRCFHISIAHTWSFFLVFIAFFAFILRNL